MILQPCMFNIYGVYKKNQEEALTVPSPKSTTESTHSSIISMNVRLPFVSSNA